CDFDGYSAEGLDFLGGLALLLGDDLDDRRCRIGIGLDVQGQESNAAETEKARERHHHQQPPREAECDQTTQHRWPRTAWSLAPLVVNEDRPPRDHQFAGIETSK